MKTKPKEQAPEGVASGKIVERNEAVIQEHLNTVVLSTVEEALNALLDAEADRLCKTGRYECREERAGTRAGSYRRKLQTKAGETQAA